MLTAHSPVAVTLLAPPPLGTELLVRAANGRLQLWHGEQLVATAAPDPARPGEAGPGLARLKVRLAGRPRGRRAPSGARATRPAPGRTAGVSSVLTDDAGRLPATGTAQWLSVDPAGFRAGR